MHCKPYVHVDQDAFDKNSWVEWIGFVADQRLYPHYKTPRLGPTLVQGLSLGGASVRTGLGGASARGSTEPRWQFGEKLVSGLKTAGSRRISL